jgi:PIN domain nuclease of toxin-antitoxin system
VTTVLLDTHVVHWWSTEPERLSAQAEDVIGHADELAVASITWYELAWLARNERIILTVPLLSWLRSWATDLRTMPTTPEVASTAVSLPASFPSDPADRIIYATAIETGWQLVTKDERMRRYAHPQLTVW